MSHLPSSLSDHLRSQFDDSFKFIQKGKTRIEFSAERILTDLLESGIKIFDALDILDEAKQGFHRGIEITEVTRLLNEAIIDHGYSESHLIRGQTSPLIVEYPEYEEFLNFKEIKDIISHELTSYSYSSKTYKIIVEELFRLLQSLRMTRFKIENIQKMIPSVTRSIIEIDPFDPGVISNLYKKLNSQYEVLMEVSQSSIEDLESYVLVDFFLNSFRFILLTYNYLPGHNVNSTISQVNSLIAGISGSRGYLSESELYELGKTATALGAELKNGTRVQRPEVWMHKAHQLMDLVVRFKYQGIVKWLVIVDQYSREIYTLFSSTSRLKYQSMVGMAITGIHSLLNEVTNDSISMIEQQDGVIVIEGRPTFRLVIFTTERLNPRLEGVLKRLAIIIEQSLGSRIEEFRGETQEIKNTLDPIITEYLGVLFKK
ncbi:MAG: hypothetical protein ACXAE3_06980 [Candidatus Kariarchaeaceae archaeon]|jgi:hypothetical protein